MAKKLPAAPRKKDGFNGQKAIVLPAKILRSCEESNLISHLFITDVGFYPKAKFHYRERAAGSSQHILIYCVDGRGWLHMHNKEIEVQRGQYIIIPAAMAHRYGSHESDPWSIYWLHFKGTAAENFTNLLSRQRTQFCHNLHFSDERIHLFNTIYSRLENGYSADNLGYINMSLWHFLSSFCYADIFQLPYGKSEKDAIDLSIDYMQENLHQSLSLTRLAAEVHISLSHYSALFKKKTGYPPLEYFNHIKIQKACQFLQFTNLQIKEIAYRLGINDPFYFSRLFTNVMGFSPLDYRKQKQSV
jgi:AraC-like DNA-binding protein/quercetin dioxygenase-like cupin family protein